MQKLYTTLCALLLSLAAGATCNPQFTLSVTPTATNLLSVTATNTSTYSGAPLNSYPTYTYNYGDGTSNISASTHGYTTPGTYTVKLYMKIIDSVTQAVFCSDSAQQSITVNYQPCGSTLNYVISPAPNGQVTFTAASPGGPSGVAYYWDFGDGSLMGTGSPVTHTYTANGNRTVVLYAFHGLPNSCSDTVIVNINVNNVPAPAPCAALHAQFTTSGNTNTVNFYNSSSNLMGYTRQSAWNYGDGNTSTANAATHSHTYAGPGTYNVKLKVTWLDSVTNTVVCSDSAMQSVVLAPQPNAISGYVITDSNVAPQLDTFKVWLIQFDPLTNMLAAVDSQVLPGSWGVAFFQFSNKPAGNYLVKGMQTNGILSSAGYVPTYHDSSLYWNTAHNIVHNGSATNYQFVWLKQGTVTSGPGFVGGNVSLGANKGTTGGVPGMTVLLLGQNQQLVASATTDANGDFSISNIPAGTYSLYPEQMNYTTIPYTFTIGAGQTSVSGINFHRDDAQMNIMAHPTGIGKNLSAGQSVRLHPNPANGTVTLSWNGFTMKNGRVTVTTVTGQQALATLLTDNAHSKILDLSALRPGLYFVHLSSGEAETTLKLVVQQ